MGGFSNFAISFSIISILTGAVILYDYGLAWAGTAAVMHRLAADHDLRARDRRVDGRDRLGLSDGRRPVLLGQPDEEQELGLVDGLAQPDRPVRDRRRHQLRGRRLPQRHDHRAPDGPWASTNTTEIIPGILNGQLVTMGILMLVQLGDEHRRHQPRRVAQPGQRVVAHRHRRGRRRAHLPDRQARSNRASTLFAIQPLDTAGSWNNNLGVVNLTYGPAISYPIILAFFFSLLQANWTYTGYDASAHVAEETVGARVASAWGLFLSVAVSAVVGFIFLLALSTHLPDLSALFPAIARRPCRPSSQYYFGGGVAVIEILRYNLGQIGDVLAAGIAIAMAFCGLSSVASAGRMLYAFSRDDGLPGCRLAQEGLAHVPDAGELADRDRRDLVAVHRRGVHRRDRDRHRDRHGHQHDLPVRGVRDLHLPGRDDRGMAEGARLEPGSLVPKPIAWIAVVWVLVLMVLFSFPTSGNISWPFMVVTVALPARLLLRLGAADVQGPALDGRQRASSPRSSASSRTKPRSSRPA